MLNRLYAPAALGPWPDTGLETCGDSFTRSVKSRFSVGIREMVESLTVVEMPVRVEEKSEEQIERMRIGDSVNK